MDMGLAQILKAEYGDVEEEEAAGVPEFTTQAELDAYHCEAGDRDAGGGQEVRV